MEVLIMKLIFHKAERFYISINFTLLLFYLYHLRFYIQHYAVEPYFVKEEPKLIVAQLSQGSAQPLDDGVSPTAY